MKRVSFKAFMPCVVLVLSAFFCACEMQLGNIVLDNPASVRSVVSLMNRSDAERMLYMGGSVLYSPKDSNASQLVEGAAVATLLGYIVSVVICTIVLIKMKLMVVSYNFTFAVAVMAVYLVLWRLLFCDKLIVGTISAMITSCVLILLYKKAIIIFLNELKHRN